MLNSVYSSVEPIWAKMAFCYAATIKDRIFLLFYTDYE